MYERILSWKKETDTCHVYFLLKGVIILEIIHAHVRVCVLLGWKLIRFKN